MRPCGSPLPLTAALTAMVLFATGCGSSTEPTVPTTLQLDGGSQSLTIVVGTTVTVTVRLLDQHGNPIASLPEGHAITWSGSNDAVARVASGVIEGVSPGTATITARSGGLDPVQIQVEVEPRVLTGALGFDYSGDRAGSFLASSTFRIQAGGNPDSPTWAITMYDSGFEDGVQDLMAQSERQDGLWDFFWFWVSGQVAVPGTYQADSGFLILGFDPSDESVEGLYELESGSIVFSSVTSQRLVGTFELDLSDEDENVLSVRSGSFDLPLVSQEELGPAEASQAVAQQLGSPPAPLFRPDLRLRGTSRAP